jgi:excinuclease UvrABC nuclease subunit
VVDKLLSLPRYPFSRAAIEYAPDEQGIYAIFDKKELIYVGRAGDREHTIRSCLLDHKAGAKGACTDKATHYTWEINLQSASREAEVLAWFRQLHERNPRCNGTA